MVCLRGLGLCNTKVKYVESVKNAFADCRPLAVDLIISICHMIDSFNFLSNLKISYS